jgi:hypothetical protein
MLAGNIFIVQGCVLVGRSIFVTILDIEGIPEYEVNVSDATPLAVIA